MEAYIILVIVYYSVLLTSGTEIQMAKELNESLRIHCPCQDTLTCTWYHNNQLLTNQWEIVPNKLDLIVPANDWSVYGVTIGHCASKNHTYVITNLGENCSTCLRLSFEPPASEYCVDSVVNVTVSTNQSCFHNINNTVTLLVNNITCNDSEIVRCDESGNDIFHYSFTATSSGNIIIEAYVNYWGADWYSDGKEVTIVLCKNGTTTAKNKAIPVIISTSVTVTSVFLLLLLSLPVIKKLGALWKQNRAANPFLLDNSCDTIVENPLCRTGIEIQKNPAYDTSPISDVDGDTFPSGRNATSVVMNDEKCPWRNFQFISKTFDHVGGELLIKEHAVKMTVPIGAIDENYEVQIQAAASLFGPFIIPEDYCPISAYVWIGACYEFKKKLKIEMEHDIVVSEETDVSELCVLTACEEDKCDGENNQISYKMYEDTCEYHYELNKTTCTIFTSHFCSKCLAIKKRKANKARRIVMYHYLPGDYKSAYEFVAEVCFCYDLTFCRERTEERYSERRMQKEFSTYLCIYKWKKDKIIILYDKMLDNWEICHLGEKEIEAVALDFRYWYTSRDNLLRDEENDLYPPRFSLKMVNKDYRLSTRNLVYAYNICIQSKGRKDQYLSLNISGFGQQILNKKDQDQSTQASSHDQPQSDTSTAHANERRSHEQQQPISLQSDQDQSATGTSQQQPMQDSNLQTLEQQLSCFDNPQQLQPAQQTTDRMATIITYNILAQGNISLLSSGENDGLPAVKTKFNSLQPFAESIVSSVDVNTILPMMIQEGLLTPHQQQDLINPLSPGREQKLCSIIVGLREECVNKFLNCLLKTNNYEPHRQLYDELYKHVQVTEL